MMFLRKHMPFFVSALKVCALMMVLCFLSACAIEETPSQEEWVVSVANCWPCTIYKYTFEAIERVMYLLYNELAAKSIGVMAVGLLFWFMFKTAKMVGSMAEPDLREYIRSVMTVFFKAICVTALLMSRENFYCFIELIISSIVDLFASISNEFLANANGIAIGVELPSTFIDMTGSGEQCKIFSDEASGILQDTIYRVYVALKGGMALAAHLMMNTNILGFFVGIFVWWMFLMLSLIMPWMFAGSFFRLGAVIVLSPLLFVAWVFPPTKEMMKGAWKIVFGSMMQILIASIYIAIAITLFKTFEEQTFPELLDPSRQSMDESMVNQFMSLTRDALSFLVLLFIVNSLQKTIPSVSGYFGGDAQKSEVVSALGDIKQFIQSAIMLVVGAVLAAFGIPLGTQLMKTAGKRMLKQATDKAKETAKDATSEGEDTGSNDATGGNSNVMGDAVRASLDKKPNGAGGGSGGKGGSGGTPKPKGGK
ncbi:MAG: hypothetical protein IKY98_05675 [Alphaproteobacteria bacterium]|nr:hypothetical protein [Alphaproteobacteria bacterium]